MDRIEIDPTFIDWHSSESALLMNPRWPSKWSQRVREIVLPQYPGHIWLASSGSTSVESKKLIALSKRALLSSADVVNTWIQSDSRDSWLNTLPRFHVGGLSIEVRAQLVGANVIQDHDFNWSVNQFVKKIDEHDVTLTSLVPTQVFDLVRLNQKAPSSLRVVFVGGGPLAANLYLQARKLGWPLLPTFGMTECSSQVATASIESLKYLDLPSLQRLPHIRWGTNAQGTLCLESPALFTARAEVTMNQVIVEERNPSQAFVTQDHVKISGESVEFLGRTNDMVKVSGELVNLQELNLVLENFGVAGRACVVAIPDERKEFEIGMVVEAAKKGFALEWLDQYNKSVAPYEKARFIEAIDKIPRTELGKVRWAELSEHVQRKSDLNV